MAASTQYTGLNSAAQRGDYRVQRKPVQLVGSSQDWVRAVEASSSRAASQNNTAMATAGAMGRAGVEGVTALGASRLNAQADIANAGMAATTSAFNSKTQADALIQREKVARGDTTLPYLKLAGGLALAGAAYAQA
jgi:hypothetical protein